MVIRALVFDFDGSILDTEVPEYEAWRHVFAEHGADFVTRDEWCRCIGTVDVLDPYEILEQRIGAYDREAAQRLRRERNAELIALELVRPGVEEWLADAHDRGMGVAVASSSPRGWVEGHLERLGLVDRFVHLSCYGAGLRAKPAPDLYLAACEALAVAPADALAVEDSPNGLAAAKAAGLRAVAVPNDMTAHLDLSAADLITPSLAALPLDAALRALGASELA